MLLNYGELFRTLFMKISDLPPVPEPLKAQYASLVADVDRLIARLSGRLHRFIRCAPGCSSCCRIFNVFAIEGALIAEAAAAVPAASGVDYTCPLLQADRCSIYPRRPLICRTQGLPIGYVDESLEQIEVSACPLNFAEDHPFTHEDLLLLDPFNARLAELNEEYCRAIGIDEGTRVPLG